MNFTEDFFKCIEDADTYVIGRDDPFVLYEKRSII